MKTIYNATIFAISRQWNRFDYHMSTDPNDSSMTRAYIVVLLMLLVEIVLFYALTQQFA
ncbi:MAG: hypothetical protein WC760_13455 [Bacteroidia bacterium]|jgi:hypothetical protein